MIYTRIKRDEIISLNAGCKVKHPIWGVGVVHECYGEGEDQKITVDFPSIGLKKLVVKYAHLENITTDKDSVNKYIHFEKPVLKEPIFKKLKEVRESPDNNLKELEDPIFEKIIKKSFDDTLLNTPIEELDLSTRALNALRSSELTTIGDIINYGFGPLLKKKRNLGKKTIDIIKDAILKFYIPRESIHEITLKEITLKKFKGESTFDGFEEKPNFENLIKSNFDDNLLNTPIEELDLSVRSYNILQKIGCKTINDIVNFGLDILQRKKIKNCGRKSIENIKNAILMTQAQTESTNEITFSEAIEGILACIEPKHLKIIKSRYGYEEQKRKTLEEIGNETGLTRERVRQILVKEIRRIKHYTRRKYLQALLEHIEENLLQYKGIISIKDLAKDKYFATGTLRQLRFLLNLIVELYTERYRFLVKYFLTSISDKDIQMLHSKIQEAASQCQFPIDEKNFIDNIILLVGSISEDYLVYYLLYKEHIEISKSKVLTPGRLSVPQRVKLLMRDIEIPMHFTEIAKLYRNHFGNLKIRTLDLERAIHTRISDSKDFIIVDPGTFILRDKFKVPANIEMIVEMAKETLRNLKNVSDTRYLINELKRRNIDVGNLNAYSLKTILLEYPGFISYRKFEIGIEELADKYERKPLDDLIFEILSSTIKPMHVKTIWRAISKQRGFPKYAIAQQLADDPRFIRISPATYTVAKNIAQYEEKQKIIIDFVKEWISLKGKAISAFFISEVLKETTDIKDLSLGLVENVLATSPEFIRLPNGFYDLIDKEENIKTI